MTRFLALAALVACAVAGDDAESSAQPKQKAIALVSETKFDIKRHVHCVAFSPDGKTLAVAEDNVHLYDVSGETPKALGVLNSRVGFGIRAMTFSPDGKKLAFGGADNSIRVWDVAGQKEVFQSKEHKGDVRAVAFAPDGKLLATGSNDKTVMLWDVADDGKLTERAVIKAEDKFGSAVCSAAFALKGKALVTGGTNGVVRVYAVDKGVKQTGGFKAKSGSSDASLFPSADGKLWGVTDHKSVHVITSAGAAVATLEGHKESVAEAAFAPDGKALASAGRDGTLHVWSLATKAPKVTKERPGKFTSVAWAPGGEASGDMTLAAALEDGTVWLMKLGYK
jgi:WD40 repeat protein